MIPQVDIFEDIIPAEGLGGFRVGVPLGTYEKVLSLDQRSIQARVIPFWQVAYRLPQLYRLSSKERQQLLAVTEERLRQRNVAKTSEHAIRPGPVAGIVELWVDVRDGVIDAVAALGDYRGRFRQLSMGVTYGEARILEPQLRETDFIEDTTVKGVTGLRLEFSPSAPDASLQARARARLTRVVVFDPKRTSTGYKDW
jgi:hypothetical protein